MKMMKTKYLCDMHTHTIRSDGNDTPCELIDIAAALGLKALVLSDHDIRPPSTIDVSGQKIDPVKYAAEKGLIFIPGIEFSCDTLNDDVHIVGMGCDFDIPDFTEAEHQAELSKVNGYRRLTEVLCENGIFVTWDDILHGGNREKKPEEVQRKHIFEEIAKKGYSASWSDAKLLVRDNPVYNVKREKIDPLIAVGIIHRSGGLAILAHPFLIDEIVQVDGENMSRAEYIDRLIHAGLDGIEACYPYDKTSYKGVLSNEQLEEIVIREYGNRVAILSGGSDYHDDAKKGTVKARQLGESGISWEYFSSHPLFKRFLP